MSDPELRLILTRASDPEWRKRGRPIQNEAQNILIKLILVENQSQKVGDKFPNVEINPIKV